MVGGEAFGSALGRRLLGRGGETRIFNEYGPTEAVVGCMIHEADTASSTVRTMCPSVGLRRG